VKRFDTDVLPEGPRGTCLRLPAHEKWPATVCAWVVSAPWAHPVWSQYVISVVHLRDVDGVGAASITRPGSTHELLVVALNPQYPITTARDFVALAERGTSPLLTPPNVVHQFRCDDDEDAVEVCWLAVTAVLNARLTPEPEGIVGAREEWVAGIAMTLDHQRDPHHGRMN
jgi:hypothetical protein